METSLRETKKRKTRQILIEKAEELFLKKGFDHITVDEISEAAGVSRSTYFRYFKTKEAVVFHHQAERVELLRQSIKRYEARYSPFRAVALGLTDNARFFMKNREDLIRHRKIVHASPYLLSRQVEFDAEWEVVIAERLIASSNRRPATMKRAKWLAGATFGLIEVVLRDWFEANCKTDLVRPGKQALKILNEGVAAMKEFC